MKRRGKILILVAALVLVAIAGASRFMASSRKPAPPGQPIAFDHWQHVTKPDGPQLECAFCHEHADKSSYATIPNTSTCMACHQVMKADSPEVQKLAAYAERAEQPPWARVYWMEPSANVFFTHKPHIKAGVECATCHGDVAGSHQVGREVNQNMGWCLDCHRQKSVRVDCYICHR